MTPAQCRASRAWLDWSQVDLAEMSCVSVAAIRNFERGHSELIRANARALETAFARAGVFALYDLNGDGTVIGITTIAAGRA